MVDQHYLIQLKMSFIIDMQINATITLHLLKYVFAKKKILA